MYVFVRAFCSWLLILLLLSGCIQVGGETKGSYAASLFYNDKEYVLTSEDADHYTLGMKAGVIKHKVSPDTVPAYHLWSNILEKGTVIYKAKENDSVLLVKTNKEIAAYKEQIRK